MQPHVCVLVCLSPDQISEQISICLRVPLMLMMLQPENNIMTDEIYLNVFLQG